MNRRPINEPLWYALALLAALALRLTRLGLPPLTDIEAGRALQALEIARGGSPLVSGQAGYVQLTGLLFFLARGSDFAARLIPALAGSLLVLLPLLLARRLGRAAALVMAFGLALDPALTAVSRQASGAPLALAGGLFALAFWLEGRRGWAAFCLGLGLLGGESFWLGAVVLALTYLVGRLSGLDQVVSLRPTASTGRSWILVLAGTLVLVGTLFFAYPGGLSGLFGGLAGFFMGWAQPSGVRLVQVLAALPAYELLPLVLGIWCGLCAWLRPDSEPVDRVLSLFALIAFLLTLVYAGRQVTDLMWVSLPLWALAARQLVKLVKALLQDARAILGQAGLVLVVWVFIWLNFTILVNLNPAETLRWAAIGGALVLILLATLLVAFGWSIRLALQGLLFGTLAAILIFQASAGLSVSGLRSVPSAGAWQVGESVPQAGLLVKAVNQMSIQTRGRANSLEVAHGMESPALDWALRDYPRPILDSNGEVQPPVVVTGEKEQPLQAASYRGEGLVWYQSTDWARMDALNYLRWVIFQRAPVQESRVILWVRADLFPGGAAGAPQP